MNTEMSIMELDAQCSELLPAREALGVGDWNVINVGAYNQALALNVASLGSVAMAGAEQTILVHAH